jgi:hypothetical protein
MSRYRIWLRIVLALVLIVAGLSGLFGHASVNLARISPWLVFWPWLIPVVAGVVLLSLSVPAESDEWTSAARALGFSSVYSGHFPLTPFRMPEHLGGCFGMAVADLSVWIAHRCMQDGAGEVRDTLLEVSFDWWLWDSDSSRHPYHRWSEYGRRYEPQDRFPELKLTAVETFALLSHPELKLPRFELRPEGLGDKFSALLGGGDINYPSHPKFSARYFLKGPDEASVGAAFGDAALLDFLGEHPGWHIRADGAWMLITRGERIVRPDKLGDFLRDVIELHGQFREAAERQRGTT